jgi:Flp pilus assembly protein TadD
MPPRLVIHRPARSPAPAHREQALQACVAGARALQLGSTAQAMRHYGTAISLAPNDADIAMLHGVALRSIGQLQEAQRELIRAIALDAQRADSFTQLAQTYRMAGDRAQAAQAFHTAATLRPTDAIAWRDAAESLRLADRLEQGLQAATHAASLAPDDPSIANTTALLLYRSGRIADAVALCERARITSPDDVHLALTHGMLCRTLGQHSLGWALYERRLELPAFAKRVCAPASPRWDGTPLNGRSILIRAEQGLGDQLQFVRWATQLHARGASQVTVQCDTPLVRLFRTIAGIDVVVPADRPAPVHSVHADCCSLPHLMRTDGEMLGGLVPYLHPDSGDSAHNTARNSCASERASADRRLRLGIVWSGSPLQEDNRFRSIPLEQLLPALTRPDVELVILQQGPGRTQLDPLRPDTRATLTDAAASCGDMYDTALVAQQCDVVLSVCTSVAHLAGALGRPTWLLLATPAEWRWGVDTDHSPYYPTMRLFRQQRAGDWTPVLQDVRVALATVLKEPRG